MKIAVPTIGSILDEYMSSCEVFTIYTIDESYNITSAEILYTPEGCDCKNNVPLTLHEKGVVAVLGYKMPEGAAGVCEKYGIKFHEGYLGNIEDVISTFLNQLKVKIKQE
jgi:predicted Fe-Mo cluster-binding NifX family protein